MKNKRFMIRATLLMLLCILFATIYNMGRTRRSLPKETTFPRIEHHDTTIKRAIPDQEPTSVTDISIDEDIDELVDPNEVVAKVAVPPLDWQAQRIRNIKIESASELMINISNFDDTALAMTSISGAVPSLSNANFVRLLCYAAF
jgi:hypothetical protein